MVLEEDCQCGIPDSHLCVDCGVDTAPGCPGWLETIRQINATGESPMVVGWESEIYMVRASIWKAAGMDEWGGCLCIGCLEKRLGR
jgi:hypothetical protein